MEFNKQSFPMDKEELIKFYNQYKLVLFPVLIGVSSLLITELAVNLTLSGLTSNNQKLDNLHSKAKNLEVKATELSQIDQTQLGSNLKVTLSALPTDQDYASAIGAIQSLTSATAYSITAMQIVASLPAGLSSKIPGFTLRVEMVGPRVTLSTFLGAVESSPRAMKVTGFEASPSKTGDAINVIVNIAVFYSPSPRSLGSTDTLLPQITTEDQTIIANLAKASTIINQSSGGIVSTTPKGKSDPFN